MPKQLLLAVCLLSLATAAFVISCNDSGNNGGSPTSTQEVTGAGTATPPEDTPTPAPDIRKDDLTKEKDLKDFLESSGGQVDQTAIIYTDLTQDGADDAIVPVSSGGEGGNIGVYIYGYQAGGLKDLLHVTTDTKLTVEAVAGQVKISEALYGEGDPLCCPSSIHVTTYEWNGTQLAVVRDATPTATGTP